MIKRSVGVVTQIPLANADVRHVLGSFDALTHVLAVNVGATLGDVLPDSMDQLLAQMDVAVLVHELTHFFQISTTSAGIRAFVRHHETLGASVHTLIALATENEGRIKAPVIRHPPRDLLKPSTFAFQRVVEHSARRLQVEGGWKLALSAIALPCESWSDRLLLSSDFSFLHFKCNGPLVLLPRPDGALSLGTLHIFESWAKAAQLIAGRIHKVGDERAGDPGTQKQGRSDDTYFAVNALFTFKTAGNPATASWGLEHLILICDLACMLDATVLGGRPNVETLTPMEWLLRLLDIIEANKFENVVLDHHYDLHAIVNFQESLLRALGVQATMIELVESCERFISKAKASIQGTMILNPGLVVELLDAMSHQLEWRRTVLRGGAVLEDLFTSREKLVKLAKGGLPAISMGSKILSHQSKSGLSFGDLLSSHQQFAAVVNSVIFGNRGCILDGSPRTCVLPSAPLCKDISLAMQKRAVPDCIQASAVATLISGFGIKQITW
jgi:hypothetical protein